MSILLSRIDLVRGLLVRRTPAGPAFSLSLRLRFAASAFAIVFLLILPNPLHVGISPDSDRNATLLDSPRLSDLSGQQPANQRKLAHFHFLGDLRRGVGSHCDASIIVFLLTCQAKSATLTAWEEKGGIIPSGDQTSGANGSR